MDTLTPPYGKTERGIRIETGADEAATALDAYQLSPGATGIADRSHDRDPRIDRAPQTGESIPAEGP
jgi:hypothetical protein